MQGFAVRGPDLSRAAATPRRLVRTLGLLLGALLVVMLTALSLGYQTIDLNALRLDETSRTIFFQIRLPRVVLGVLVGASLAAVGASLQALFRNPLADPFVLGVSGGGAVGATVAIAFGLGARVGGVPLVFVTAFLGAAAAVFLVYRLATAGTVLFPGALLLAGVVLNLIAGAAVLVIQYLSDYTRALQILRWMVGSLDVVGFGLVGRMLMFLVPGLAFLLATARDLHLLAVDEEAAASLGVDVHRVERRVYLASALLVGVTVAVAGPIGFVGLIVPHAVRLLFGEDLRIVLPGSLLLGSTFLVLADTLARTALGAGELPVGAVTALAGGPLFLWLLRRQRRYSAM
ncbi:MAG: FecCD family ABC transporter permease [Acidobacteriota bacterium]